jgi:hypothetical protein
MKRFLSLLVIGLSLSAFGLAASAQPSLIPVKAHGHRAQRHRAHKAARHHAPKRHRRAV